MSWCVDRYNSVVIYINPALSGVRGRRSAVVYYHRQTTWIIYGYQKCYSICKLSDGERSGKARWNVSANNQLSQ